MLSNESLLLALNSGCLNSQAFLVSRCNQSWGVEVTNIRPVRRLPCFFIVLAHFVEVVLVELADETGKVAVFEVFGENGFGEFFALQHQQSAVGRKLTGRWISTSSTTKLSFSSPQRTMSEYDGSSNILARLSISDSSDRIVGEDGAVGGVNKDNLLV